MKVRTRFAPSPTGYMHVGNLRSALFGYLVAKHDDGDFILRIEDTDQTRLVEEGIDFIYDTLDICGIKIDEGPKQGGNYGPYVQSERLDIYNKYARELVEKGEAYYCFCTEEELKEKREEAELMNVPFMYDGKCRNISLEEAEERIKKGEPYVIRQKMPKEGKISYTDMVYGDIEIDNSVMEDQILIKSDKFPTYNFANVVDDHLMDINVVMRGNEYLSSTPKYLLLYKAFGWESPLYIHLPHIVKEGGKKLSKRSGDASFMDLYNDGYLVDAIINYLTLLGWSPKDNNEFYTLEELIKVFDYKDINRSPAVYDIKKLRWFNSHYIKEMDIEKFKTWITKFIDKDKYDLSKKSKEWLDVFFTIYQDHISYGKEINDELSLFIKDKLELTDEMKEFMDNEDAKRTVEVFKEEFNKLSDFNPDSLRELINTVKEKSGNKGKMLYMPIRIATTGLMHGPELPETLFLVGKDKILERLK